MKAKNILIIILAALIYSCSYDKKPDTNTKKNESEKTTFPDNSRNSLDWAGIYSGMLPCADCEGIKMSITLKNNLTYEREMVYMGKNAAAYKSNGNFRWNEEGNKITLINKNENEKANQYLVGENKLIKLDLNGNIIQGNLKNKYVLEKNKSY